MKTRTLVKNPTLEEAFWTVVKACLEQFHSYSSKSAEDDESNVPTGERPQLEAKVELSESLLGDDGEAAGEGEADETNARAPYPARPAARAPVAAGVAARPGAPRPAGVPPRGPIKK